MLQEDETGIRSLTPDPSPVGEGNTLGEGDSYNLAGQKVPETHKGVVIVNNKKVLKR